jgi:hypothetical protein
MSDSIFDPSGPNTEHSGSRYMGPDAANISHLPTVLADENAEMDEAAPDQGAQTEAIAQAEIDEESDKASGRDLGRDSNS